MEESENFLVSSDHYQEDMVGNGPSSGDSGSETDRPGSYNFYEETGIVKARETRTAAIEDLVDHRLDANVFVATPQGSAEDQIETNGLAIRIDNIDSQPTASMHPLLNGSPIAYSGDHEKPHIKLTVFSNNFHGSMRDCVFSSIGNMKKSSINQSNAPPDSQSVTVAATNSPKIQCGKGCRKPCRFSRDFPEYIMKIAKAIDDSDEYRERLFYHASSHSTGDLKMLFPETDGCTTAKDFFLKCLGKRDDYELNWMHFSHLCALLDDVGCKEAIDILKKYKNEFKKHLNDCLSLLPTPETLAKEEGCSMWVDVKCGCNDKHFTLNHALEHEEALIKSFGIDDHTIAKIHFYKGCVVGRYKILSLKTANDLRQKLRIMSGAEEINMDGSYTIQVPLQYSCLCDANQMQVIGASVFKEDSQADCESGSSSDHESADDLPEATFVYMPKMKMVDQHSLSLSSDLKKYVMGLSKKKKKHLQKFTEECPTLANSSYTTQSFCSAALEIDRCWNFLSTYGLEDVVEYLGDPHLSKELKIYQHILSYFHSINLQSCKMKKVKLSVGPNIEIHLATFMGDITIGQIQNIPTLIQQAGLPRPLFLGFSEQHNILYFQLDAVASLEAIVSLRNYLPELKTLGIDKMSVSGQWELLCDEDRVVYTHLKLSDTKTSKEGVPLIPDMENLEALLAERNEMKRKLHELSLELACKEDECTAAKMKLKASKVDHEKEKQAWVNEKKNLQTYIQKIDQLKREQHVEMDKISKENKELHEIVRKEQKETFEEEWLTIVNLLKPITNFEFDESDENLSKDIGQPHKSWEETKPKVAKEKLLKLCMKAEQKFEQLKHVYEQLQQEVNQIRESSSPEFESICKQCFMKSCTYWNDEEYLKLCTSDSLTMSKQDHATGKCSTCSELWESQILAITEVALPVRARPLDKQHFRICPDMKKARKCSSGAECVYAHSPEELTYWNTDLSSIPEKILNLKQIENLIMLRSSVVKIEGLKLEDIDKDTIDIVFSNEDHDGGEITNIEFQEDTVYITFVEPTVAERVTKKQWSVMDQDVTVSVHQKGIDKLLQVALSYPSHAFIVDNVPKDIDYDRLLLRLEKSSKLKLDWETSSDIEAVLQHKGTKAFLLLANGDPAFRMSVIEKINQSGLRFSKTHPSIKAMDFPAITQISVSNIDDKKCRDALLRDYFSDRKKSSGGPVKKVDVIGRGRAIVSFEDSSSVESTMEHNHKEYLGSNVTLHPHHPLFEEWSESQEPHQEKSVLNLEQIDEEFRSSVVKVEGLELEDIDEDIIDNVFSNEDKGGGEIANIDFLEDMVYITFKEPTVAESVAKKQWSVMGQDVTVSVHQKDMDGIDKLLQVALKHPSHAFIVDNVPKDVDHDRLLLRLEKSSKLKLDCDIYTDIEAVLQHKGTRCLLLLANGDPAFRMSVIEKINGSGTCFSRTHPSIKAVEFPALMQISVSNIDDKKCRDALLHYYFSNRKKSSGGPVKKVDVIGRGRAIVSFEDSSSVESTMEHNHREYLGSNVTLHPHHPLFEEWLESSKHATQGSKPPTTKKNQFTYPISSVVMCEHVERKHLLTFVNDKLKDHCASAKLNTAQKHLIIKPKPGSEFIEDWSEKCTEAICSFFQLYSEEKVSVCESTTDAVFRVIFRLNKQYPNVDIIEDNEELVCIVGPTQDVQQIQKLIHKVVTENMDSEERESLPAPVLVYIQDCIQKELQDKYKHVMIKVLLSEGVLEVTGKSSKCQEFLTEIRKLQPFSSKVPVSEMAVHMLACPLGRKYLLSKMPKGELMTYYFTGPDDSIPDGGMSALTHLYLVANDATAVAEVADKIKGSLVTKQIPVPREFKNAERSRAWEDMKKKIESRYVAGMFPDSAAGVITIVSEKSQANNVEDAVEAFKQRECYAEKTIAIEHGQWKYLRDFSKEWTLLEAEIKISTTSYKIPTGEERGPTIVLEGETTPVKKLAQKIQQLRDSISIRRCEIARPGLVEHFCMQEGKKQLIGIGVQHHAIVEVSTAEDREFEEEQIAKQETHPLLISGTVGEGATVEVRKGDLTEFPVDVMVNAANEQLNHGGGIAGIISRKGGPIIQEESTKYVNRRGQVDVGKAVILNGTGNLPCKSIVHAVGPQWRGGKNNESALLSKAVYSSLRRTEENRFQSISFPAISSGIFGVPVNMCAKAMFDGICKFFEDSKYQMKVVIMLYEDKHVEEFLSAAKESLENPNLSVMGSDMGLEQCRLLDPRTPERHVSVPPPVPLRPDPKPRPAVSIPPLQTQISPAASCIEVKKGSLTDINVDVYINTTASDLVLSNGAVSNSLLKAGGQGLQDECTAHVQRHGNVKEWSFATTGPGNLKCKHVVHTVGGSYNGAGGSAEKGMEQMMTQVMEECDRLKASSVAIPSTGAGNLGFPDDVVARILLETVSTYLDQNRDTSIKKVIFAIFDGNTHSVFQMALIKLSSTKRDPVPSPVPNQYWAPANVATWIDVKRGSLTDHKHLQPSSSKENQRLAIETVESRRIENSPVVPGRTASKSPLKAAVHQASQQTTATGSSVSIFQCNNVKVKIMQGDITEEACDGIVNTASEKLTLNKVGLQGALLRKGGQELQDECKAVFERDGPLSHGAVRVTGPGRRGGLKCTKVLHVLPPNKITKPRQTVKYVLDKASTLGLKSIALPVIGADEHTFDKRFAPSKVVRYIYEAIIEYSKRSDFTVTEVSIVSAEANYSHEFGEHFLKTGEHRGILNTFKGGVQHVGSILPRKINKRLSEVFDSFQGNTPNDNGELESQHSSSTLNQLTHRQSGCLVISVYGNDEETVKKVIADIEVVIESNFNSEEIIDDRVTDLSPDMIDNLRQLAASASVELDVYQRIISLEGQKTKVAEIAHRIKEQFHEIDIMKKEESFDRERRKKERQDLEEKSRLATSSFCWQWRDQSGTFVDFDSKTSSLIEEAHKDNKGIYTFKNREGVTIQIDFATNQMTDQTGNATEVKRHDFREEREEYKKQLAEVSNPAHWVPMPVDKSGRELVWHPVTLSPTDQEYQEVLQEFEKTMTTGFRDPTKDHYTNILAITRIQNPTLYGRYMMKKKQMNEANPARHQNERRLFHGCPVDAVENINKTGYNRSYSGGNATVYGLGSYFARDASYSSYMKYSPPDGNGKKHVYLAKVLTGEFTQGEEGMKEPPNKDEHRKYDSVVNQTFDPSIFVVFFDTQAYPEYLIEFTA